jgi:transposase InsO family protein
MRGISCLALPIRDHAFFEQTVFQRQFRHNFLQGAGLTAQILHLVRGRCARRVAGGWFYLSTVLDDFSRYIIAWKLCTTMKTEDITATLELALKASGLDHAKVIHRPRLLSDNGSSYIARTWRNGSTARTWSTSVARPITP